MSKRAKFFLLIGDKKEEVSLESPEAIAGIGQEEDGAVYLMPYEALYILEKGLSRMTLNGAEVEFQGLFRMATESGFNTSVYLVYRDLKEKGYYIKRGLEPYYQLSVARGGEAPSSYKVIILKEGEFVRALKLLKGIKEIIKENREPLLAIVDRRGEITYYKAFIFHGEA